MSAPDARRTVLLSARSVSAAVSHWRVATRCLLLSKQATATVLVSQLTLHVVLALGGWCLLLLRLLLRLRLCLACSGGILLQALCTAPGLHS